MVAADEVLLDPVENVEPHRGSEKLGAPLHLGIDMRLGHGRVANVLGDMMSSHLCGEDDFFVAIWLVESVQDDCRGVFAAYSISRENYAL